MKETVKACQPRNLIITLCCSRTIIEKILATKKNEEAKNEKDIEMGISFLRSTFVSLRRNRKKKRGKDERKMGKLPPCHYRTLQHINCMILEVFPFSFPPSLFLSFQYETFRLFFIYNYLRIYTYVIHPFPFSP